MAMLRPLPSVRSWFQAAHYESPNAQVGGKSNGGKSGHGPHPPVEARRWLGTELDAACEYTSKRERRNTETTERNAEQTKSQAQLRQQLAGTKMSGQWRE